MVSRQPRTLVPVFVIVCMTFLTSAHAADDPFPGAKSKWNGFDMYQDKGRKVVVPHKVADDKPWVWRARFWGHQPQFDIALLNKGYHLVYCDVGGLYGAPKAVKRWPSIRWIMKSAWPQQKTKAGKLPRYLILTNMGIT